MLGACCCLRIGVVGTFAPRVYVDADTRLIALLVEVLESLSSVFAPREANEAIPLMANCRWLPCSFRGFFTVAGGWCLVSVEDLAADNLSKRLKITL